MRSRLAMLALCAMSAFLAASLPAVADGRRTAEFDVEGSNGYTAYFDFSARTASVDAIRLPDPLVLLSATYISKGRWEGDRIRARFGSRGRVAVEFRPSGEAKRRQPPRRCEGAPRVTRPGVFLGTIAFNGEGGYTSVDATRARGETRTIPRWKCKRGRGPRKAGAWSAPTPTPLGLDPEAERFTVLGAESDDGRTSFAASATRPRGRPGETTFNAVRLELRPSLRVLRSAFAHGTDETFTFDEALSTASVQPPPPFAGTATFTPGPGGLGSWEGSLSVDFPGAADIPLTGEAFHARLFRRGLFGR